MKLKYERISKENIELASKIQLDIFPNSSAYTKYLTEINNCKDLPIDFLVYEDNIPIGVIGLYEIKDYPDTIWLSWFGVLKEYRFKGYGAQIFEDIIVKAKKYNKKFLRLFTYELWNHDAQIFYKKHMQIEEYYTNKDDDQFDIKEGKCKIFGISLCDEPINKWDNKFINIALEDREHAKSIMLMKKNNII